VYGGCCGSVAGAADSVDLHQQLLHQQQSLLEALLSKHAAFTCRRSMKQQSENESSNEQQVVWGEMMLPEADEVRELYDTCLHVACRRRLPRA
jgi:hypothetical protein